MSASTSAASLTRRAIGSSPAARAIVGSPPLRRRLGALRAARVLRPRRRFLAGEMRRAGGPGCYALGATGLAVYLRHGSRDVEIFNEIFRPGRASYEPPPAVSAALSALGPLRVGDLGGNIGLFGLYALQRWPVAWLRSFEPDPANAALLQSTIAANDARAGGRWELAPVAVSNTHTTATFEVGLLSESRLAAGGSRAASDGTAAAVRAADDTMTMPTPTTMPTTMEVTVVDLFEQAPVDLLKIDIEGAEWAILGDPRLASHPARAIVLEWHRRMCPAPKARHAARALLEMGGYEVFEAASWEAHTHGPYANGTSVANGLMWGLRR